MAAAWRSRTMMAGLAQLLQRTLDVGTAGACSSGLSQLMGASASRLPSLRALPMAMQSHGARGFAASADGRAGPPDGHYIVLNDIRDNPGSSKTVRRLLCCFPLPTAALPPPLLTPSPAPFHRPAA
jgi:hypothetical protein